jgi:hypothetical protein
MPRTLETFPRFGQNRDLLDLPPRKRSHGPAARSSVVCRQETATPSVEAWRWSDVRRRIRRLNSEACTITVVVDLGRRLPDFIKRPYAAPDRHGDAADRRRH